MDAMGEIVISGTIAIGADQRLGTHVDPEEAAAVDSEDEVVEKEADRESVRR